MPVRFYGTDDPHHGGFSNFAPYPFMLDGAEWPTVEHYRSRPLRPDWEAAKDDVMRAAVRAKFAQHADIRATLLGTGDEEIIENAPRDYYWGCGAAGTGKNMLGIILMETRAALREAENTANGEG